MVWFVDYEGIFVIVYIITVIIWQLVIVIELGKLLSKCAWEI